jgi:hypothetical protein
MFFHQLAGFYLFFFYHVYFPLMTFLLYPMMFHCASIMNIYTIARLSLLFHSPKAIRAFNAVIETPDEDIMVLRTARMPLLDVYAAITAERREG